MLVALLILLWQTAGLRQPQRKWYFCWYGSKNARASQVLALGQPWFWPWFWPWLWHPGFHSKSSWQMHVDAPHLDGSHRCWPNPQVPEFYVELVGEDPSFSTASERCGVFFGLIPLRLQWPKFIQRRGASHSESLGYFLWTPTIHQLVRCFIDRVPQKDRKVKRVLFRWWFTYHPYLQESCILPICWSDN